MATQKIMTKDQERSLIGQREMTLRADREGNGVEAVVFLKLFGLGKLNGWRWYITEYDAEEDTFFGLVTSPNTGLGGDMGYISKFELEDLMKPQAIMSGAWVERDLGFMPKTLAQVRAMVEKAGVS